MGNICTSPQYTRKGGGGGGKDSNWPSTAKIVHIDGRVQEFRRPIKACHVLSQNPTCFLCSSESMYVDSLVPPVRGDEELQLGQLYFLMPYSKSNLALSLQDLGALAVKASAALACHQSGKASRKAPSSSSVLDKNGSNFLAGYRRCCQSPANVRVSGEDFPAIERRSKQL